MIDSSVTEDESTASNHVETTSGDNDEDKASIWRTNGPLFRFTGLVFMCLLGFGSYFCYDGAAALQDNIQSDMDLTTSQFTLLYSWYSWPNVILCFIGGFLLDSVFGIGLGTCIYATLVVVGQIVFATGGLLNCFWLMIVGRFIFGIGGESLAVAQNNYAVVWFKGKELNMVFGLQLSFARLGSTVNFLLMEPLYQWVNQYYKGSTCTGLTLLIAGCTTVMSLMAAIILAFMERRVRQTTERRENESSDVAKISDIKEFPVNFWMVCLICIAYYVAIFPFIALGKVFFERKFKMDPHSANQITSIVYLISSVASPLLGYIVDLTGRNVFWVFLSILITIGAHSLLAFTFVEPYIGVCILGLAYSMLASGLWPMIALVIPEYQLGTAYGIAQSVQNFGLAVTTMMAGAIVDSSGYVLLEVFFLAWLCVSLIAITIIWIYDAVNDGMLNLNVKDREIYEKNRRAAEEVEREKLLASGSEASVTAQDLLLPRSDFHMRNRYLSRIGAVLPSHYSTTQRGQGYRALR